MSDHREFPPSSRNDSAKLEPGVRAARERVRPKLTQEQVAERMNVSIHTYRPWDQGKRRPARLEQVQLLAFIVEAPIDVIWPATDDPLVAEALRLERERGVLPRPEPPRQSGSASRPDVAEPGEILVRRLEKAPVGSSGQHERASAAASANDHGIEERGPADDPGGLPPWPDEDELAEEEQRPTDSGPASTAQEMQVREAHESSIRASTVQRATVDHSGATTLHAERPAAGRQVKRVVVALGAALAIGSVGTVVASALGERPADADPSSQTVPAEAVERERAEVRAREVATMRAAADRGDYDAAIVQARQLNDPAAEARYRESAARVLVGRAEKAARRGDLSLARSRLRAAKERYDTASGAAAVQARVRRIERQRRERAQRQRAESRRTAAAASAEHQRAAADAARANEASASDAPAPSTSSAAQSSTAAPSSSSSKDSGSGGGSGGKKDPEQAVDPGLF
jgi:transcriptional regulator with XRE-family HTH domain